MSMSIGKREKDSRTNLRLSSIKFVVFMARKYSRAPLTRPSIHAQVGVSGKGPERKGPQKHSGYEWSNTLIFNQNAIRIKVWRKYRC